MNPRLGRDAKLHDIRAFFASPGSQLVILFTIEHTSNKLSMFHSQCGYYFAMLPKTDFLARVKRFAETIDALHNCETTAMSYMCKSKKWLQP